MKKLNKGLPGSRFWHLNLLKRIAGQSQMPKFTTGFTLIELLTVIAIISILTAIVVPSLNNARIKGRDAKRVSDIKSIQLALSVYYDTHRTTGYPLSIQNLVDAGYLPSLPKDTLGNAYVYSALGSSAFCSSYHLGSKVEGNVASVSGADDRDLTSPGTGCTCNGVSGTCVPGTTGSVFNGNATNCSGSTAVSPDMCYDVTP